MSRSSNKWSRASGRKVEKGRRRQRAPVGVAKKRKLKRLEELAKEERGGKKTKKAKVIHIRDDDDDDEEDDD